MGSKAGVVLTYTSTGEVGGTWGSSGAATRKWHGVTDASLTIVEKVEAVPTLGYYGPGPVADQVSQSGEGTVEGVATYEDLPNILNGLFTAHTTGSSGNTSGGTVAPYYYSWSAPITSTQVSATYTLEYGTSGRSYTAIGGVLSALTLRGEAGGLWTYTVPLIAKQVKPLSAASTAAWIDRLANPVQMSNTHFYWDALSTGTVKSTELQATLISFELTHAPNRHLKTFAGSKFPGGWGDNRAECTLTAVVEFNSTMKALLDAICTSSGAAMQAQISIFNENTTSTGSTGRRSAEIQFAGIQTEPIKLWDDRDGNLTLGLNMTGKYSTALGNYLKFIIENGSSSTT